MYYFHKIYADPGNKIDHSKNKNLFCKIQTTREEGFVCLFVLLYLNSVEDIFISSSQDTVQKGGKEIQIGELEGQNNL